MKREAEIRELLINNAIHLIAKGGFEMATTKELTHCGGDLPDIKMNEVYIYRIFGSKDNLFAEAFRRLDKELHDAFREGLTIVRATDLPLKEKMFKVFSGAWKLVTKDEDRCRCYVRYYYSVYFKGDSLKAHNDLFLDMISDLVPLFKEEADVIAILHSVFTTLLDFAIRYYNGDLEDREDNRAHIFNVVYCMMSTYFKVPTTV